MTERIRGDELASATAHIARALQNRLETVQHYLSLLRPRLSEDSGGGDVLDKASQGLGELADITEDLVHFAAHEQPQLQLLSVGELINAVRSFLAAELTSRAIRLVVDVPEDAWVTADRELLERAIHNLMQNACDAMPAGGELVITAVDGPDGLELEIADNGPGLTDEARSRAFEPFFLATSSGAGLRLAVVYHILEQHGGHAVAMNCPDGGAAFTLCIPHQRVEVNEMQSAA